MSDRSAKLAGALADRYTIERELGQGGMATVYRAHDLKHDRDVAIKVLHPDLGAALGGDRFLSEIRTTARLQHPHILPLLDSGEADGLLYYVMPLVTGETLRARLERERQLPVSDAILIAREVADALEYAHGHGVIHRDIKPENILLQGGHAVVADFGIALAVQSAGGARMTQTGLSLGTPQYMSPEQAMGERAIDARSDIYALGAVTYEMLAGDPPFTGSSVQAIVAKVLTEKPSPIRTVRDTVPESIEDAVLIALAKLPADRWPTAAAFSAALDGHGPATRARNTTHAVAARRWSLRSPIPWAVAFGLAMVAAVWGWLPRTRTDAPPVVRLELQPVMGTKFAFPVTGVATELALSPDGSRVIYAASAVSGEWMLYLRNLDQLVSRPIPGTAGAFNPEFSPDGKWIAFRSADGKLKKVAEDGSSLTTLCAIDNGGSVGAGLSWISDKEIVFARGTYSEGRGLWRVSADGGEPVQFTKFDSASNERLQLSPVAVDNGRLVLYSSTVASNADLTMGVVEMATGRSTVLTGLSGARAIGLVDGFLLYVRNDGALMAAPFDVGRLRAGAPMQIADSIAVPASAWSVPIALSANGSLLYQKGGVTSQLVTVNNGATQVLLDSAQIYLHPRLSPDGRRIAVEVQGAAGVEIWIEDLVNHTSARLTHGGFNNRPEWTPDGRQILYTSSTRKPADALWLQPADGSADATLMARDANPIREGVITPDGQSVVYRVDTPSNNRDIYRASLTGDRTPVPLLVGINDDKEPRVSSDSRWLAYVSNESGREEVYVRAISGDGGRVQVSTGGGGEPVWSHDGRRLFYRAGTGIVAATVVTSPSLAVTGRALLFDGPFATDVYHPNYDVEPDGQTFVMVRPIAENRQLVLVVNWLQELRQRTRTRQ